MYKVFIYLLMEQQVAQDLELDLEQVGLEQDLALAELARDFSLVGELDQREEELVLVSEASDQEQGEVEAISLLLKLIMT